LEKEAKFEKMMLEEGDIADLLPANVNPYA